MVLQIRMSWFTTIAFFTGIFYGGFCGWMLRGERDEEVRRENSRPK